MRHVSFNRWFAVIIPMGRAIADWLRRSRLILGVVCVALLVSGCVRYDVNLQFDHASQGRIVQHIQLEERLKSLSGAVVQEWISTIERRTQRLGGSVQQLPDQGLQLSIPFSSGADLTAKFNQFFPPANQHQALSQLADELPAIDSQLTLIRNNFLLVERNRLSYSLDLRSLGVLSANGELLLSPRSLMHLEFRVSTPWGGRILNTDTKVTGCQEGRDLVWSLVPGELNQIEAVFWLPSPLGIGSLVIVGLIVAGMFVKYPQMFQSSRNIVRRTSDPDPGIIS